METTKKVLDPITEIARIACELTGVQLNERHHEMIRSRLQRRLTELKLASYQLYLEYFLSHREQEVPKLIGLMTTHHTYFFREYSHFEFIAKQALPKLLEVIRKRPDRTLRIWSAAASRGQEAYSISMFMEMHLKQLDPTLKYEILGTDIDPESIAIASNGVYLHSELKEVPVALLGDHWARGSGAIADYVKVKKTLREKCTFKVQNLLQANVASASSTSSNFDLIFCRNVFIYFNQEQIESITRSLLSKLSPEGYLFVGISESLSQMKLPISSLGPSVYQHKAAAKPTKTDVKVATSSPNPIHAPTGAPAPAITQIAAKPIRVLCVDDSDTILVILKKILTADSGFEVVGTAENGKVAHEKCLALKPDVMTLDIHMPVMDGIEYLTQHFNGSHPPVLMLTSVNRENADLAGKALSLGAADYIEKPALSNISLKSEEIKMKIKCAVEFQSARGDASLNVDRSFQSKKRIPDPASALRVAVFNLGDRKKLAPFIKDADKISEPPTLLMVDANLDLLPSIADQLSKEFGKKIHYTEAVPQVLKPGEIYLGSLDKHYAEFQTTHGSKMKTSIQVYGTQNKTNCQKILTWQNAQLVIEELKDGKGTEGLREVANYVVPATSFEYHAFDFLSVAEGKAA